MGVICSHSQGPLAIGGKFVGRLVGRVASCFWFAVWVKFDLGRIFLYRAFTHTGPSDDIGHRQATRRKGGSKRKTDGGRGV